MSDQIKPKREEDLKKQIEFLKTSLSRFTDSNSKLSLIEQIKVEAYGSRTIIKAIASVCRGQNINTQNFISDTAEIILHDQDLEKDVKKALLESGLGTINMSDKKIILVFPPITVDSLKNDLKKGKELFNTVSDNIRQIRHDCLQDIKEIKKNENLYKRAEKDVESLIKKYQEESKDIFGKFETVMNKKIQG